MQNRNRFLLTKGDQYGVGAKLKLGVLAKQILRIYEVIKVE